MPNQLKKPTRQKTTNSNLSQVTENVIQKCTGTQIFWSFNGQSWTTENLKSLALACGLTIPIKEIPVTNGMHNAVSLWKSKSNNGILTAKKVHMDSGVFTFGILEVAIDSNGKKAKGVQIDSVSFDSVSKTFLSKGNTEYAKSLCETIQHRITHYTGNEFRKWIIMEFLNSLHAIRMMGGSYFVDSQHDQQVSNFEKFCNACGVTLHLLKLAGDKNTKNGIASIAKASLQERISELQKKLQTMKEKKRVRSDGRDGAKKEIEDIRFLASRLKKSLEANTSDLDQLLVGLDTELDEINNKQPTQTQTSGKVIQIWKNAIQDKYKLGNGNYKIPFDDFDQLLLPKTAQMKFYWKPEKRFGILLADLGFTGKVSKTHLLLKPLS